MMPLVVRDLQNGFGKAIRAKTKMLLKISGLELIVIFVQSPLGPLNKHGLVICTRSLHSVPTLLVKCIHIIAEPFTQVCNMSVQIYKPCSQHDKNVSQSIVRTFYKSEKYCL